MQQMDLRVTDHPFFEDFAPQHVQQLAVCTAFVQFAAGQYIYREGAPAREFFLIRNGLVALEIDVPGRGNVTIQTLGDGDVLGWSWLFPPHQWVFTARALEATDAFSVDADCVKDLRQRDPELGLELMDRFARVVVQRLQATRLQLLDVYGATAERR